MSAIIVAGGVSKRFGQDKGLIPLAGKPLILHVLDRISTVANETIIVVSSEEQKSRFSHAVKQRAPIIIDKMNTQTPLGGALAGLETVKNKYTLLLACDTPFLLPKILSFLLDVCPQKSAVIPRWPNCSIEPLQAAYHAKTAAQAVKKALENDKLDMQSMIDHIRGIRYISTLVLQQFDPKLTSFYNINTMNDLNQAEATIKRHTY